MSTDALSASIAAAEEPPTAVKITLVSEFAEVSASQALPMLCMASISAPTATPTLTRSPVELVAVVDRSGSMGGEKIKLMKETLEFVVTKGLLAQDSFSIVAYDHIAETQLPLTLMDATGKKEALAVIRKLGTGGATNLSGGLLQGIDVVSQSSSQHSTKALMLFTDGMANHGITDTRSIVNAMAGALRAIPATPSIFTFGFGADHSEDMLRGLADEGQGLYYFIEGSDTIPTAFADCLGGLISVVAQNVTLSFTAHKDIQLENVLATYKTSMREDKTMCTVNLGDMYAEDKKDILIKILMPALPALHMSTHSSSAPDTSWTEKKLGGDSLREGQNLQATLTGGTHSPSPPLGLNTLSAELKLFNVLSNTMEVYSACLAIARPATAAIERPVNPDLDVHRNRINAAEAMEGASQLADAGNLQGGRELLQNTLASIRASHSANSPLSQSLIEDLARCEVGFRNRLEYREFGSRMSKMSARSNMQQRSTHNTGGSYRGSAKREMMRDISDDTSNKKSKHGQ